MGAFPGMAWRQCHFPVFLPVMLKLVLHGFLILAVGSGLVMMGISYAHEGSWRTASRASAGIAPDPAEVKEAVVQVYAARAWSWRGAFGVHTWIAVKPTDAIEYTVYEVIGWRARAGLPVVSISTDRPPDGRWFGNMPDLLVDLRGEGVDDIIAEINSAAHSYPYPDNYTVWPGPNSNTFVAHVAREVPALRLDLPPTAIGKDYLNNGKFMDETPSNTGYQVSLYGLLGVLVGAEEGLEVNVLGLTFGIDPKDVALKLPMIGRIGGD